MSKKKNYSIKLFDTTEEYIKWRNAKEGPVFYINPYEIIPDEGSEEILLILTRQSEDDRIIENVQYYAYLIFGDSSIVFLKEILEQGKTYEDIGVYIEGPYDGSVVNMADMYSSVFGMPSVFKISPLESDFILTMTLLVPTERYAQLDRDDLYAYGNITTNILCLTECEYIEDGLYENQTVYVLPEGDEELKKHIVTTIKVNCTDRYIEPHLSLCKDTMKLNYNSGTTIQLTGYFDGYTCLISDSTGNPLIMLSDTDIHEFIVPADGVIMWNDTLRSLIVDDVPVKSQYVPSAHMEKATLPPKAKRIELHDSGMR